MKDVLKLRECWESYKNFVKIEDTREPLNVMKRYSFVNRVIKELKLSPTDIGLALSPDVKRCMVYHAQKKHKSFSDKVSNPDYYGRYKRLYSLSRDFIINNLEPQESSLFERCENLERRLNRELDEKSLLETRVVNLSKEVFKLKQSIEIREEIKGIDLKHIFSAVEYANNIGYSRSKIYGKIKRDGTPYFKTNRDGKQCFFVYDTSRVNTDFQSNIIVNN